MTYGMFNLFFLFLQITNIPQHLEVAEKSCHWKIRGAALGCKRHTGSSTSVKKLLQCVPISSTALGSAICPLLSGALIYSPIFLKAANCATNLL